MGKWTFVTNHGAVLALIAQRRQITAKAIAAGLGITERSVLRIISGLEADGYLKRTKVGRVNSYEIDPHQPLRRREEHDIGVGELLAVLTPARVPARGLQRSQR